MSMPLLIDGPVQVHRLGQTEACGAVDVRCRHQMEQRHGCTCLGVGAYPARVVFDDVLPIENRWRPVKETVDPNGAAPTTASVHVSFVSPVGWSVRSPGGRRRTAAVHRLTAWC